MSDSQIKTIENFFHLLAQPAQTAALNTALRLGVVECLTGGQKTVTEVAEQCSLNLAGTAALLQILTETGLLEQFDEFFALSQAARLTPRALWAITFEQWTHLEKALQNEPDEADEPEFERQRGRDKRRQQFEAIHSQIQWAATGVALKACEALGIGGERKSLHILDLGCGAAIYSMTMAHRDAGTIVKLVDHPIGLARARTTVNSLEIDSRVEMTESEALTIAGHDSSFDMVLIADQIHLLPVGKRRRVLATAFRTLVPGGEIAVIDVFPGQPRGKSTRSLFELQLLTGTGNNSLDLRETQEQLESAGFQQVQFTDLPVAPYTHGLVLALKPADA